MDATHLADVTAPLQRAEIIAVGSEMLTPAKTDTNSLFITGVLNEIGIEVASKAVVGDRIDDVMVEVQQAIERVDLVVVTGGLGPTDDDVTRDAVARVLGRQLVEDPAIVESIRVRFKRRGMEMPEINRRQAMVPHGGIAIDNPNGSAPGLWIEDDDARKVVLLLPGPPRELQPMLRTIVAERLAARTSGARMYRRAVHITGRSESHVDEALAPAYARWLTWPLPVSATILAALGQIELHLSAIAPNEDSARETLDRAVADVMSVIGGDVYSTDGESMEVVVGALLKTAQMRIAAAESCTGGLLTSRLTDVPGSSVYVERSVIVYSNEAKTELLGVPKSVLDEYGAVSEPVAQAMARGIRERAGVDFGVGITGIAGPDGGTDAKPVGTVAIAVAGPRGDDLRVRTYHFAGGRAMIKFQAAQAAMDMVRRTLAQNRTTSAVPEAPAAPLAPAASGTPGASGASEAPESVRGAS
jgi:nicotinamide-nucleotide amidase